MTAPSATPHFDVRIKPQIVGATPVKPSHPRRRGRPLPTALSQEQLAQLCAQIQHPMDHARFWLMRRCGLRVSEGAQLTRGPIDWAPQALRVEQGNGRKDRYVSLSADAVARVRACLTLDPGRVPGDSLCWKHTRATRARFVTAIHKKLAARREGGWGGCQLPSAASYVCLEPARAGGRDGLHPSAARTCLDRLPCAIGEGVEWAGQQRQ